MSGVSEKKNKKKGGGGESVIVRDISFHCLESAAQVALDS